MTDFNALIPDMSRWNNGAGIDVDGWICGSGTFQLAIGYSRIFWPKFVEFEGLVLRVGSFTAETVAGFMQQSKGDKSSVEAVINHIHIETIHGATDDASRERLVFLGNLLKDIYSVKLAHDFPHRVFEVLFDDSFKEHLIDYQLTFFQKR